MNAQPGILAPVPRHARFLEADLPADADPSTLFQALLELRPDPELLVGLGLSLVQALGARLPLLRPHPLLVSGEVQIPSTPAMLLLRLSGDDPGEVLHAERRLLAGLPPLLVRRRLTAFKYRSGLDLSGYEDGTENPEGEEAAAVALSSEPGLEGSSFLAVQQWEHELQRLERMSPTERDHCIGRRQEDNEELDEAPPSAHVKRAAQESFSPEAFLVRRSMPWAEGERHGLVFLAFGRRFDAYEAILRRMAGLEDGVHDALFRFTRPVSGACYWCPALREGRLDLRVLR